MNDGDPNEAVTYNLGSKTVTLASGNVVPIASVRDEEGNVVDEATANELCDYEKLFVVAGPVPGGVMIVFAVHADDRPVVLN